MSELVTSLYRGRLAVQAGNEGATGSNEVPALAPLAEELGLTEQELLKIELKHLRKQLWRREGAGDGCSRWVRDPTGGKPGRRGEQELDFNATEGHARGRVNVSALLESQIGVPQEAQRAGFATIGCWQCGQSCISTENRTVCERRQVD